MTETAEPRSRQPRWRIGLLIAVIGIATFGVFMLTITVVDYTESTKFCSSCHIMAPEVTVYRDSPHARTECGTCHRGPGAWPLVKAEIQNIRYLWIYPLKLYPKPIPSPIHSLRPVEVVCEQCHWPQKFYADRLAVLTDYGEDEFNSVTQTAMLLKTGGGSEERGMGRGIHWHIANPVWYIAADEQRQEITWVRAEYNSLVTDYLSTDSTMTPEEFEKAEVRKMDCVDCHNRATHVFLRPTVALDEALALGQISADLPSIKAQAAALLERTYETEEEAAQTIKGELAKFYQEQYPDLYTGRRADIDAAIAGVQGIFDRTQFPFMDLTWETHPNNIGHKDFPGCFRCHDGKHLSADNQAIRLECNICHTIPRVALPGESLPDLPVSSGSEPGSHRSSTWLAEHRFQFDATCAECHTIANPGGSDNSSFCSNSACHASEWQYVGLDAPRVRELSAPPAEPAPQGIPAPVPHPIAERTDCTLCHGPERVRPAPDSHASFGPDMCTGCHSSGLEAAGEATPPTVTGAPPNIPHDLEGRDNCLACHDPEGQIKPAPKDHAGRPVEACRGCHQPVSK